MLCHGTESEREVKSRTDPILITIIIITRVKIYRVSLQIQSDAEIKLSENERTLPNFARFFRSLSSLQKMVFAEISMLKPKHKRDNQTRERSHCENGSRHHRRVTTAISVSHLKSDFGYLMTRSKSRIREGNHCYKELQSCEGIKELRDRRGGLNAQS